DGRVPGLAVGAEADRGLVAADGGCRERAVAAVDGARREAAAAQQELERGHVPAAIARHHRAAAEQRAAAAAERAAGPGAGNAVDGQVVPALERPHGALRARPRYAVDAAVVEV